MVAPAGAVPPSDLLPDLLSNSAVFNVGDYSSAGYMASVTQALGEHMNLTLAGGSGSALIPSSEDLEAGTRRPCAVCCDMGNAAGSGEVLRHGSRHSNAVHHQLPLGGRQVPDGPSPLPDAAASHGCRLEHSPPPASAGRSGHARPS